MLTPNVAKTNAKNRSVCVAPPAQVFKLVPVVKKFPSKFNAKKLPHVRSSCAASVKDM